MEWATTASCQGSGLCVISRDYLFMAQNHLTVNYFEMLASWNTCPRPQCAIADEFFRIGRRKNVLVTSAVECCIHFCWCYIEYTINLLVSFGFFFSILAHTLSTGVTLIAYTDSVVSLQIGLVTKF